MRVVRKTYVLNPKLREEHDDKAFKITRVCELCRKPSRLVDYPKVFGVKTKAELGLKPVAGGLDSKVKVIIGEPANKNVTIKNG
jgi:hypothetical protein